MSKQLIDFQTSSASTADTGEVEASAIRPVANTEPASEATFNRPTENLRARTEILRKEIEGIKYLLDADRAILLSGGGAINWNATAGTFTIAQNMSVRPFMSPAASKEAKLVTNGLTITADKTKAKPQRAYGRMDDGTGRGANDISVEIVASATATAPYAVTVTGAPANNVKITISTNVSYPATVAGLKTFLNAASAFTGLGLSAAGTATDTLDATFALASTRLQGALDAELHVITPAGLVTFFNTAANALLDGDCLVVAYDKLVEPTGAGGRRQSLRDDPEKSSASPTQTDITVVDNNLANLSAHPEKVTYAIPICTREGTDLVFLDGTRIRTGIAGSLGGIGSNVGETISGNLNVTGKVIAAQSDTGSGFATADTAKARFRGAASTANTTLVVEAAAGQTGSLTAWTDASGAAKTVIDSAGLLESKVATGTAPLKVASSTKVGNLNADKLDDYDWNDVPALGTSSTTVTAGTVNANTGLTRSTSGALAIGATGLATTVELGSDTVDTVVKSGKLYLDEPTAADWAIVTRGGAKGVMAVGEGANVSAVKIGTDAAANDKYIDIGGAGKDTNILGHLNVAGDLNANGVLNANAGIGRTGSGNLDIGNDADVVNINIGTVYSTGQVNIGQTASAVTVHAGLSANANATIRSSATTAVALTVEGESSGHTQNLQEWKANGATVASIAASGTVNADNGVGRSTSGTLALGNDAQVTAIDIGTASNTGTITLGQTSGAPTTVNGLLTANANAVINSASTSTVALTINGETSGHTENLQEWKANNARVAYLDETGTLSLSNDIAANGATFDTLTLSGRALFRPWAGRVTTGLGGAYNDGTLFQGLPSPKYYWNTAPINANAENTLALTQVVQPTSTAFPFYGNTGVYFKSDITAISTTTEVQTPAFVIPDQGTYQVSCDISGYMSANAYLELRVKRDTGGALPQKMWGLDTIANTGFSASGSVLLTTTTSNVTVSAVMYSPAVSGTLTILSLNMVAVRVF